LPDDIDLVQAAAAVTDPETSGAALQSIAASFPNLWAAVARHPNAYPDLLDWLARKGDAEVQAICDARQGVATQMLPAQGLSDSYCFAIRITNKHGTNSKHRR